jgi:hypothetical protein
VSGKSIQKRYTGNMLEYTGNIGLYEYSPVGKVHRKYWTGRIFSSSKHRGESTYQKNLHMHQMSPVLVMRRGNRLIKYV